MSAPMEEIKSLKTIYLALTAGVSMIFIIMVFLIKDEMQSDGRSVFFIAACCLVLVAIFISDKLFKSGLSKAERQSWILADAVQDYRSRKITQWAMIEGPTLISIILMFLDKNFLIAAPAFAGLIMLVFSHVKEEEFNDNYNISNSSI